MEEMQSLPSLCSEYLQFFPLPLPLNRTPCCPEYPTTARHPKTPTLCPKSQTHPLFLCLFKAYPSQVCGKYHENLIPSKVLVMRSLHLGPWGVFTFWQKILLQSKGGEKLINTENILVFTRGQGGGQIGESG